MSFLEETSNDLRVARDTMHKLDQTLKDFQSYSFSIFALGDRWKTLNNSFDNAHKSIEERVKEVESKERDIDTIRNRLDNIQKEIELRRNKLNLEEKSVFERVKEVELREREVSEWRESLELERRVVEERCKAVAEREKAVEESEKAAVESKERIISEMLMSREKKLRMREEQIEEKTKGLEYKEMVYDKRCGVLEDKAKRLLECVEAFELEKKGFDERLRLMEFEEGCAKEKQNNDESKGLTLKQKQVEEQSDDGLCNSHNAQLFKEKQSGSSNMSQVSQESDTEIYQAQCSMASSSSSVGCDINLFCRSMDADGLRSYVIQHMKDKNVLLLQGKILDGLRYAPDSGKFVIAVCRNFQHKFPSKDKAIADKNSCILILKQFIKLSPPITQEAKYEATHFAASWITKLKAVGNTPADNFGFLQFLVAFNLTSSYNEYELVLLFSKLFVPEIYRCEQLECLCSALGLMNTIPGFIKSLIERNRLLTAVKYICVFKQDHKFAPAPLLQTYLDQSKNRVIEKQKIGSKIGAECSELSILREVTNCISTFKLESEFPPDSLLLRIKELLKIKGARKPAVVSKQLKKRNADSYDSFAAPKQLQKRPRLGN